MRVLLLTYGTRGDVEPFVALGQGLRARGHEVMLVTSKRFEDFVKSHDLAFSGMSDTMLAVLDTAEGKNLVENTQTILDSLRHSLRMWRRIGPMLAEQLDDSWRAARDFEPEFVVYHPKGFAGPLVADRFECPALLALLMPMLVATGERPHLGFPALPLGSTYNRFTHRLVLKLATASMKGPLRKFRARHHMPRGRVDDILHRPDGTRIPSVTAISPSVFAPPNDWTPHDQVCGYWFVTPDDLWRPPADLLEFLDAGPAPVYVGFGSMAGKDPTRLARVAVDALQASGQRGVLATGWGGLAPRDLPASIFGLDAAPHAWLFERVAAVVHHGGAGTTAAAFRAGVPSIVVPFMGDQPFWGERVARLGVGPSPIPQKKLTGDALATAITRATTDAEIRREARSVGLAIQAEDGVGWACRRIEALAGVGGDDVSGRFRSAGDLSDGRGV